MGVPGCLQPISPRLTVPSKPSQSYYVFPSNFHNADATFYNNQGAYSKDKKEEQIKKRRTQTTVVLPNQREDMHN